jgi:hypothetical protein
VVTYLKTLYGGCTNNFLLLEFEESDKLSYCIYSFVFILHLNINEAAALCVTLETEVAEKFFSSLSSNDLPGIDLEVEPCHVFSFFAFHGETCPDVIAHDFILLRDVERMNVVLRWDEFGLWLPVSLHRDVVNHWCDYSFL